MITSHSQQQQIRQTETRERQERDKRETRERQERDKRETRERQEKDKRKTRERQEKDKRKTREKKATNKLKLTINSLLSLNNETESGNLARAVADNVGRHFRVLFLQQHCLESCKCCTHTKINFLSCFHCIHHSHVELTQSCDLEEAGGPKRSLMREEEHWP